jgi:hypothetical protein
MPQNTNSIPPRREKGPKKGPFLYKERMETMLLATSSIDNRVVVISDVKMQRLHTAGKKEKMLNSGFTCH